MPEARSVTLDSTRSLAAADPTGTLLRKTRDSHLVLSFVFLSLPLPDELALSLATCCLRGLPPGRGRRRLLSSASSLLSVLSVARGRPVLVRLRMAVRKSSSSRC